VLLVDRWRRGKLTPCTVMQERNALSRPPLVELFVAVVDVVVLGGIVDVVVLVFVVDDVALEDEWPADDEHAAPTTASATTAAMLRPSFLVARRDADRLCMTWLQSARARPDTPMTIATQRSVQRGTSSRLISRRR
jgi:hypothetical protein